MVRQVVCPKGGLVCKMWHFSFFHGQKISSGSVVLLQSGAQRWYRNKQHWLMSAMCSAEARLRQRLPQVPAAVFPRLPPTAPPKTVRQRVGGNGAVKRKQSRAFIEGREKKKQCSLKVTVEKWEAAAWHACGAAAPVRHQLGESHVRMAARRHVYKVQAMAYV